jgi:hypothetical protein
MSRAGDEVKASRALVRAVIDSDAERTKSLTRKARRRLARLRCGISSPEDTLQSAVCTLLRRQDPKQFKEDEVADRPVGSADDVWKHLEKHLDRKIDTAAHQYRQPMNQGLREADLADEADRDLWLKAFVATEGGTRSADPEIVESYISDALATLWELLDDNTVHRLTADPTAEQVLQRWILEYSQRAIAEELDIPVARVIAIQNLVKQRLQSAEDRERRRES